jgi:hypothetical protein
MTDKTLREILNPGWPHHYDDAERLVLRRWLLVPERDANDADYYTAEQRLRAKVAQ